MEQVRKEIKNEWDKDGFDSMLFDWKFEKQACEILPLPFSQAKYYSYWIQ